MYDTFASSFHSSVRRLMLARSSDHFRWTGGWDLSNVRWFCSVCSCSKLAVLRLTLFSQPTNNKHAASKTMEVSGFILESFAVVLHHPF